MTPGLPVHEDGESDFVTAKECTSQVVSPQALAVAL